MPKSFTRRRIDGKPPRLVRRAAGGGATTEEPTTSTDITVIATFSGGGPVGTVATFDGALMAGDVFLVAFAYESESEGGGVSINPHAVWWAGASIGTNRGGVSAFKVAYNQGGVSTFTVTVAGGESAYYGWVLRGVQNGLSTPNLISTYDLGLVSYVAPSVPDPDPCVNPVGRTDFYGPAVLVSPGAGSFGVYAATTIKGPCDVDPPLPTPSGDGVSVMAGTIAAVTGYDFGTISGGAGTMEIDASAGTHGTVAGLTVFAVAPLAGE
jgi:hypothetical protein